MKRRFRKYAPNPVFWGALLSLTLIGFVIFWASWPSTVSYSAPRTNFEIFLKSRPNEVGDFLAGVAGALAFIWIIVTVALQSKELRAQREVLKLTQKEVKDQRKATEDMARAMQAQAGIFEDEKLRRAELRNDEHFLSLMDTLLHLLTAGKQNSFIWVFENGEYRRDHELPTELSLANPQALTGDYETQFLKMKRYLLQQMEKIESACRAGLIETKPTYSPEPFLEISNYFGSLSAVSLKSSPSTQEKLNKLAIHELAEVYATFIGQKVLWDQFDSGTSGGQNAPTD